LCCGDADPHNPEIWTKYSPLISGLITYWSSYSLLINLLLHQLKPFTFRIFINLVQFTWSDVFCQSMQQAHNSLYMYKVHFDIIRSIPFAFLVPFSLPNLNWSSLSTSSFFSSVCLLNIVTTVFAVCVIRLIVRLLLHFVAVGFFFMAIIVTPVESLGYCPDDRYGYLMLMTQRGQ